MDNFAASLLTHDTHSIFTLARQHVSRCSTRLPKILMTCLRLEPVLTPRYVSRSIGSLVLVIAGQLIHYGAQGDQQIYIQSQYSVPGLPHRVVLGDVTDDSEVHSSI
jgi:hypothetical protein